MVIKGFFPHKSIQKFTWQQAYKNLKNIIHYVVERQESKFIINDVRIYRAPVCGSEYFMLKIKVYISCTQNHQKQTNEKLLQPKYSLSRFQSVQIPYKWKLAPK